MVLWWTGEARIRSRLCVLFVFILLATAATWIAAGVSLSGQPGLLTAAGLSYSLGLRHALDADHISAIDNVTRKLMAEGKYSTTVGFFFSLGHASLVIGGCCALYFTERAVDESFPNLMKVLNIVSSVIASVFLLMIAALNFVQLVGVHHSLNRIRRDKVYVEQEAGFAANGLISYCAGGLFKLVDKSWKMLLVGFVFGLGFDTTASVTAVMMTASRTETEEFSISFSEAILLPLLFTCGMVLVDTMDSIMMLGTYRWSDRKIVRRLFFNYVILIISITAAFFVGIVIGLSVIVEWSECENFFCSAVSTVDANFQYIGVALTLFIAFIWVGGYFYYVKSHWYKLEDEVVTIQVDSNSNTNPLKQYCDSAVLEDSNDRSTVFSVI